MIKSKFYLIRGDGVPIYVGFTNRTIKQRFSEHKAYKDFSDYERVTIEKLDELDYEFTWDEDTLYKNANEVSVREAQLVLAYGTQDSCYQKAIGGGQVWAYEKYFVKTNKDNPKFDGMSNKEVEDYFKVDAEVETYLQGFVCSIQDKIEIYLHNFVSHMRDEVETYLHNFVNHMRDEVETYLGSFVNHMQEEADIYIINFVNNMQEEADIYIINFVNHMQDKIEIYLHNFVSSMRDEVETYLINFVNHMCLPEELYLSNFVTNMNISIYK